MFRVPAESAQIAEQLGSREKYWFTPANEDKSYLYKLGRPETGEHWAEVVVARICDWLEIPHAEYQLATNGETMGVVTWSIVERLKKADTGIWSKMFDHLGESGITDTAIEFSIALLECNAARLVTSL